MLSALALLALSACGPRYSTADWSLYVSKSQPLRFIAGASCTMPNLFNPVAGDAGFFEIGDMEEVVGRPWRYDVVYMTNQGWRQDRFDIKQWWGLSNKRSAPASETHEKQICAVIAELPRPKESSRPYFIEPAEPKTAEYRSLLDSAAALIIAELAVFTLALIPSWWGYERSGGWRKATLTGFGVLFASLVAAAICIQLPWEAFQKALTYYKFFDDLPRATGGFLLPVSSAQFYFLVAGPPHPSETQFWFAPFAAVNGILASVWLLAAMPAVVRGLYWLFTPLPLEAMHQQALREGRTPTAPKIMAAVLKASVGKSAWQLNIMRRKADAFAQNLSDIARHL